MAFKSDLVGLQNSNFLQCSPGYEDISGTCEKCKIGFYKAEYAAALCKECLTGFITSEEGTDNAAKCSVPACDPGYYLTNNNCEKCPYDKYQPEKWQSSCKECPTSYVTQKQGATNVYDCVLDCPSGEQYRPVENDCSGCERGYYRDKNDRSQITCQICPVEFITPGERATSVTACTVSE
uniref:Sushi, von Willebrand factor type A, EGF and pentraxin domain-containing protein 1 n=1 Tax=Magallana gigas TaxID=29159 RepID=K1Q8I5_MAGGI